MLYGGVVTKFICVVAEGHKELYVLEAEEWRSESEWALRIEVIHLVVIVRSVGGNKELEMGLGRPRRLNIC